MTKIFFAFLMILSASVSVSAQTKRDTLMGMKIQALIDSLKMIDSTIVLISSRDAVCKCIDKIKMKKKRKEKIAGEIKECIEKEVTSYQLMQKMMEAMKGMNAGKNQTIIINTNNASDDFEKYYYEIERELRDSCESLKRLLVGNEQQSKNSISNDKDARSYYTIGQNAMKAENYEDAIKYFSKSVKIDPKFAFAWDNLGICNRKAGKYKDAIEAYNKSLELDPKGITALQNLPATYIYTEEYDKAVESYKKLMTVYPEDPEAYYGLGQVYSNIKDFEKALDYMCKAYNVYVKIGSPYRTDAEREVQSLYSLFKKDGKEDKFNKILKDNHITTFEK
jgi:tetratricopeptide (TPR) repeat protein